MKLDAREVERRTEVALAAIKSIYCSKEDDENCSGPTSFVLLHLEEIEGEYWQRHLQTASPEGSKVLDILVLCAHWSDDDKGDEQGIDNFDFTLPDDVTQHVLCVRFDKEGSVDEVVMES